MDLIIYRCEFEHYNEVIKGHIIYRFNKRPFNDYIYIYIYMYTHM